MRGLLWSFPVCHVARYEPEQRVDPGTGYGNLCLHPLWSASFELDHQVVPFEVKLALRNVNLFRRTVTRNFFGIEPVFPCDRFRVYSPEILGDKGKWSALRSKPGQLGMGPVTPGLPLQNGLSEQCLTPQRDQPARVKVTWVKAPKAHTDFPVRLPGCVAKTLKSGPEPGQRDERAGVPVSTPTTVAVDFGRA